MRELHSFSLGLCCVPSAPLAFSLGLTFILMNCYKENIITKEPIHGNCFFSLRVRKKKDTGENEVWVRDNYYDGIMVFNQVH